MVREQYAADPDVQQFTRGAWLCGSLDLSDVTLFEGNAANGQLAHIESPIWAFSGSLDLVG